MLKRVKETNDEFSKIGEGVDCTVYIKGNTDDATKKINSLVERLSSIGIVKLVGNLFSFTEGKANGGIYSNGHGKVYRNMQMVDYLHTEVYLLQVKEEQK